MQKHSLIYALLLSFFLSQAHGTLPGEAARTLPTATTECAAQLAQDWILETHPILMRVRIMPSGRFDLARELHYREPLIDTGVYVNPNKTVLIILMFPKVVRVYRYEDLQSETVQPLLVQERGVPGVSEWLKLNNHTLDEITSSPHPGD